MAGVIEAVAVVGLGRLGSRIALQAAAMGWAVRAYDPDPSLSALTRSMLRAGRVDVRTALGDALAGADLVIEALARDAARVEVLRELRRTVPRRVLLLSVARM